MINRAPLFNLKAVLKETGLTADVLRIWEKRYHIPSPERSKGGHRLYSQHDIETIKWLQNRTREGIRIGQAVDFWKELAKNGKDPLTVQISQPSFEGSLSDHENVMDDLRAQWLNYGLNFDEVMADEVLKKAFALSSVESVCSNILQKGLNVIGTQWYQGKITVQQEHFVAALVIRHLQTLISISPSSNRSETILLACPEGENHTIPILILSLFLRREGYKTVFLGAGIPTSELLNAAKLIQPSLVILSAQQFHTAATLQSAARSFLESSTPLAYGGGIFMEMSELCLRIPAYYLSDNLLESIQRINFYFTDPQPIPAVFQVDESYVQVNELYQRFRRQIELSVIHKFEGESALIPVLESANFRFYQQISSALQFGDMNFLKEDLEWLLGMMSYPRHENNTANAILIEDSYSKTWMPDEYKRILREKQSSDYVLKFINAYSNAIAIHMGSSGKIITDFLNSFLITKHYYPLQ